MDVRVAMWALFAGLVGACEADVERLGLEVSRGQGVLSATPSGDGDVGLADVEEELDTKQIDDTAAIDTAVVDTTLDDGADDTLLADVEGNTTGADTALASGPERYPEGRLLSPVTPAVAARLREIAGATLLNEDAFMKVGASSTESSYYLACFAGDDVELDGRDALLPTIAHFDVTDAAGTNPFSRHSLAAKSGRSAVWAISGSAGEPSPVEKELEAIAPRFALVHYGTNDMQLGTTYESAAFPFADNLLTLVDQLIAWGVVPIVSTISRRLDIPAADPWVPTYNAIIRGVTQGRQVILYDMGLALDPLPSHGLSSDGLHPSVYREGGSARPCVFTDAGLQFGYNMRNLRALEALDLALDVVVRDLPAPDDPGPASLGDGSPDAPFEIPGLPYTDLRDTRDSPWRALDLYSGCGSASDESGPEFLYRLELGEATTVRAMVFDRGDVDIDLHLLDETASVEGCLARAHRIVEADLAPGTYYFALDTFVSGGAEHAGEYLFVLLSLP